MANDGRTIQGFLSKTLNRGSSDCTRKAGEVAETNLSVV
jgi:hypothetical protein